MKGFEKAGLPRMLVRIKCALLTLSEGQGEAKNTASRAGAVWGGGGSGGGGEGRRGGMAVALPPAVPCGARGV